MYIVDLEKKIIHDMSFVRYECRTNKISDENKKKIYGLSTVKRMFESDHVPRFNGCQYCMSEHYTVDLTSLFQ